MLLGNPLSYPLHVITWKPDGSRHGRIELTFERPRAEGTAGAMADTYRGGASVAQSTCSIPDCGRPIQGRQPWCHAHYERHRRTGSPTGSMRRTPEQRFWAKVDATEQCWLWTAARNAYGYGSFQDHGSNLAHRWSYLRFVGPIPDDRELDHLCRVRHCVNPAHLEPVTRQVNVLRGEARQRHREWAASLTHCRRAGHPLTPENVRVDRNGWRACRECLRAAARARYAARKVV